MKVLHITNAYPYEGHPEYGCFIKEQIASTKDKITSDVLFINAHKRGALEYLRSLKEIRKRAKEADVVHCHHLFSFIAFKLSCSAKKPVLLSFLNDWTKEVKLNISESLKNQLCHFYVKSADKVIFKSFVPSFLKGDKYLYLPNGVDTDFFNIQDPEDSKKDLNLVSESKYILFVSSKNLYRKQKRYDVYLKVIEVLKSKYPSSNYEALTMSTDNRVNARNKINAASLHLLCSDYEGSPNSVKEALSSGVPVIARPAGSVEDLLNEVPHTAVVHTDNYKLIADEVHTVLNNSIERQAIRKAFLHKSISKEQVAEKLFELYSSLV